MARLLKYASGVAIVLVALAGVADAHHLCMQYGTLGADHARFYEITADDTQTKVDRYDMSKSPPELVGTNSFGPVTKPATHVWNAGVEFANELKAAGCWPAAVDDVVSAAHWEEVSDSEEHWRFETTLLGTPFEVIFSSATCAVFPTTGPTSGPTPAQVTPAPVVQEPPATAPQFNCKYAGSNNGGINCKDNEVCCGDGTMNPQCLPAGSDRKCCTHYIAAATCGASQSCCGEYGVGASSTAFCCDAGSTCCHAQSMSQGATCCAAGTTCCAGTTVGLCCAGNQVCNANQNTCDPAGTPAQVTNAPAVATPGAQTTQAPQSVAPVTTSIVNGNGGGRGRGDWGSAFGGSSSAWILLTTVSVVAACAAAFA